MAITLMLAGVVLWLAIFWIGSIALEATGLERTKARFQVLSAITGTGFTTSESEAIVNHPRRRRIATWLIFIGNTGVIGCIIVLLVFLRVGIKAPSPVQVIVIVAVVLAIVLFITLGPMNKLTNTIIRLIRKGRAKSYLLAEEVLHRSGEYGVTRVAIGQKDLPSGLTAKDTGLGERGVVVLAIERGDTVLPFPMGEETLSAGDYLLCYGKISGMPGDTS
ncbi:MAG: hypothetical protein JSV77_05880 [Dehalococcoidales bacterium]|nr:MAG: hypothetical protein JSV77_05880 [Dehalococcoidales bacterium]